MLALLRLVIYFCMLHHLLFPQLEIQIAYETLRPSILKPSKMASNAFGYTIKKYIQYIYVYMTVSKEMQIQKNRKLSAITFIF